MSASIAAATTPLAVLIRLADLRRWVAAKRQAGQGVALVPTMGALHAGHQSLVQAAVTDGLAPLVSIFVNPTQFGPNEDFTRYPRTPEADLAAAAAAGAQAVFMPEATEIYPAGFATTVQVAGIADHLDGPFRPGHFAGVATVVGKLLNMAQADAAYFGEKDWQQLQIIRRLSQDLDISTRIVGVPIMREADGLALSSRNRYLAPAQSTQAVALITALREAAAALRVAPATTASILAAMRARLKGQGFVVDYFSLNDAATCAPLSAPEPEARLFVAARLGGTRLIDNWPVAS